MSRRDPGIGAPGSRARGLSEQPSRRPSDALLPGLAPRFISVPCPKLGWAGVGMCPLGWWPLVCDPQRGCPPEDTGRSGQLFPQSTQGLEPTPRDPAAVCLVLEAGPRVAAGTLPLKDRRSPRASTCCAVPWQTPAWWWGVPPVTPVGTEQSEGVGAAGPACHLDSFVPGSTCPVELGSLLGAGGPPVGCAAP